MTTNELLFVAVPYVAVAIALTVTILRWRLHPFSVSSLSSQLLESRRLYWGSIPFHWGLSVILLGHLVALIVPSGFRLWNGAPARLYLLEGTGLALGFWAGFGIVVLIFRRLTNGRVKAVTSPMDLVVLIVIAVQIATGIWVAIGYRWGSSWGPSVLVPYLRSLLVFNPRPDFVDPMPFVVKAHVLSFYAFVLIFPFTRLVHIITLPLGYLRRPWQKVVRNAPTPAVYHPAARGPMDRVH